MNREVRSLVTQTLEALVPALLAATMYRMTSQVDAAVDTCTLREIAHELFELSLTFSAGTTAIDLVMLAFRLDQGHKVVMPGHEENVRFARDMIASVARTFLAGALALLFLGMAVFARSYFSDACLPRPSPL